MKNLIFYFLLSTFLLSTTYAQKVLEAALGDNILLNPDSFIGEIHWEFSYENEFYDPLEGDEDGSLRYTIDALPIYFRARINREGCKPHYSEVIEVVNRWEGFLLWSSPETWNGSKPIDGQVVTIEREAKILLDENTPALGGLMIEGTLAFAEANLELTSEWIQVSGRLEVGSETSVFQHKAIITLNDIDLDEDINGMGTRGIVVMGGGQLELHGATPDVLWTKIGTHAEVGSKTLELVENVDWEVGDEIVIAPTDYYQAGGGISVTQKTSILDVSINSLGLNDDLGAFRWGALQYATSTGISLSSENLLIPPVANTEETSTPIILDERAEVGNLTRNIIIQAPDDEVWNNDGFGVHTMIMPGSEARIDGVEFKRAGQRGRLRRYPFHWHMLSYSGTATLDDATNQYIRNSSINSSTNRGIVIHGTNGVMVQNNIIFDVQGHGIFTEDAVERRNIIDGNLILHVRNPPYGSQLMLHEVNSGGANGSSGLWIANPDNTVINNTVADCQNFGFWLAFPERPFGMSSEVLAEDGGIIRPNRLLFGVFDNNTAHSNRSDGLHLDDPQVDEMGNTLPIQYWSTADGRTDIGSQSFENLRRFKLSRFNTWKNMENGSWDRGVWTDMVEFVSADNCGRFFAGSGAEGVIERSLVVGTSLNHLMNGTGRPSTADPQFFNDASDPTAFATYHSTFNIQNNIVMHFPVYENVRSGVFASDDYYLRPVEKGMVRNTNNLILDCHPGVKLPAAYSYYTLASALWDPYGFWGPEGNYFVYDDPFLTYGKEISLITLGSAIAGGVTVPGPFYGVSAFILDGTTSQDFDLMAIEVNRYDLSLLTSPITPDNFSSPIGTWEVTAADQSWALNHMRDFAVVPQGVYELTFPTDPLPTDFLFEVENMLEPTDHFVIGIEFDGAIDPVVFLRKETNWNINSTYSQVGSLQEVLDSNNGAWWQDKLGNKVWVKIVGGIWSPEESETSFEDIAYEKMQLIITPAN